MSYLLDFMFRVAERFSSWLLGLLHGELSKPTPAPNPKQAQAPIVTPSNPIPQASKPVTSPQLSRPIAQPQPVVMLAEQPQPSMTSAFAETCEHYHNRTGQSVTQSAKHKGLGGEMRTFGFLCAHFPKDYVFCDVYLPFNNGVRSQVDIILVTNFEIYIIENKDYRFPVYGGEYGDWFFYKAGKKQFIQNPIAQNMGHVNAFLQVFDYIPKDRVVPVVIFNNLAKLKITTKSYVMRRDDFLSFVDERSTFGKPLMPYEVMQEIRNVLLDYSVQDQTTKTTHLKYAKFRYEQHRQNYPHS